MTAEASEDTVDERRSGTLNMSLWPSSVQLSIHCLVFSPLCSPVSHPTFYFRRTHNEADECDINTSLVQLHAITDSISPNHAKHVFL